MEKEKQLNELALFAGVGGGVLGSKLLGWRTVCYVENNPYCARVIIQRIKDGFLDDAPIWDDVRTFDGRPWAGCVDIITGGFPCQPWSLAGRRLGEMDENNLWPDTIRIIREIKPQWILLENVTGILSNPYIRRIFTDLAESGYSIRWDCIPAAFVGAPHLRYRLWIVAHTGCIRCDWGKGLPQTTEKTGRNEAQRNNWWTVEPGLGRVADGVANRMDRLKAIGNGQVPAVVRAAWNILKDE